MRALEVRISGHLLLDLFGIEAKQIEIQEAMVVERDTQCKGVQPVLRSFYEAIARSA